MRERLTWLRRCLDNSPVRVDDVMARVRAAVRGQYAGEDDGLRQSASTSPSKPPTASTSALA